MKGNYGPRGALWSLGRVSVFFLNLSPCVLGHVVVRLHV